VITSGGIVAIPLCIVSSLLKIPVIIYELNAVPGKATLFLSSFAQTIYVCFDVAKQWFKGSVLVTEYPLRSMQLSVRKHSDRCTIVILGGSQGSIQLNTIFLQWLEKNEIYHKSIRLFHQTGSLDTRNWNDIYASKLIEATIFEYTQAIEEIYSQADIIICRGGAGTLFEILHCNKRAIVIPLEHVTTNHQWDNAHAMAITYPELFSVFREREIIANMQPFNELLSSIIITQESKWHEDYAEMPISHQSVHE
jgi:UDP-N-acetylglucosamine--N-acetylmuramyl-(pentapeptide) pyrophosphoryl-undecaprenol N-acetylglucosamine transferase